MSGFNKRQDAKPARPEDIQKEKPNEGESSNYLDILLKYKQMAGNRKGPGVTRSANKAKVEKRNENKFVEMKYQSLQSSPKRTKPERRITQIDHQKEKQGGQVEGHNKIGNGTRIKFITEKEHQIGDVEQGNKEFHLNLSELRVKIDKLGSTKKSSSLPSLGKGLSPQKNRTERNLETKSKSISNLGNEGTRSRVSTLNERLEKERSLNSVAFLLTSLKQKYGSESETHHKSMYKMNNLRPSTNVNRGPQNSSFYSEMSPNKMTKSKLGLIELSNISPVTLKKESLEQNAQQSPPRMKEEVSEKEQMEEVNPRTVKQKIANQKLEQIKEDIENENNEKEELLKEHRKANKNLEISILEKSQRINQLQAQLSQFQVQQGEMTQGQSQNDQAQIAQLQEEKLKKEKLFKEQKQSLKQEIARMEKRIVEQENKYNNLRESQLQLKDSQIREKEKEIESKSKKMAQELESERKQLEEVIKKEQQKSKLYKLELEEQARKNDEISNELRKQEQLEQLLLKQIEKIAQQRKTKMEKQEEQRNKEKLKLIQEIKDLEEAEHRILMEYQRDSQAVSSIFESMRIKNLELEDKLRKAKKDQEGKEDNL